MLVYHITPVNNLPSILTTGIVPGKPQVWQKQIGRFPPGYIYFTGLYTDACRWAFKLNWELSQGRGRPPIAIINVDTDVEFEDDDSPDRLVTGCRGLWFKTKSSVGVECLQYVVCSAQWMADLKAIK